nr:hypothetical protein Iba_chr10aCG15210 [Ipomoea batatas]GMD42804.1 hypothetical protein Iba_chr10bCG12840 [Ipomoea batatas]GMD44135.1 hypothetical protein Iba_chr10cCG12010 [Ipomoea batatas]GMD48766.1 hypothetical protein Iba_chr10fCG9530 [Ipomoea batatas]
MYSPFENVQHSRKKGNLLNNWMLMKENTWVVSFRMKNEGTRFSRSRLKKESRNLMMLSH